MMVSMFAVGILLSLSADLPITFDRAENMLDAKGVVQGPLQPAKTTLLIPSDPEHPKLWYSPVAVHQAPGTTFVWYQRVNKDEKEYTDQRTLCLGAIRGDRWETPAVQTGPPAWGGVNNVVLRRSPYKPTWGGFNVFQIVFANGHFRMLYWDQPEKGDAGAMLAMSVSGVKWIKDPRGTVFTDLNDAFTILPKTDQFFLYQTALEPWPDKPHDDNLPNRRRIISLRTSSDLASWTPQTNIILPDELDLPTTEFYLMKAFPLNGRYMGLLMKYWADPDKPAEHSALTATELIVSSDALTWQRPYRQTDLGFWTYAEPYLENGMVRFVVGRDGRMELLEFDPARLVGVSATGDNEGSFITPPFTVPGADLALDADTRNGQIDVELLDSAKKPMGGFYPCRVSGVDGRRILLEWEGFGSSQLPAVEARLRFRIRNATLFAVTTAVAETTANTE